MEKEQKKDGQKDEWEQTKEKKKRRNEGWSVTGTSVCVYACVRVNISMISIILGLCIGIVQCAFYLPVPFTGVS